MDIHILKVTSWVFLSLYIVISLWNLKFMFNVYPPTTEEHRRYNKVEILAYTFLGLTGLADILYGLIGEVPPNLIVGVLFILWGGYRVIEKSKSLEEE